jgi:hypothetical protein
MIQLDDIFDLAPKIEIGIAARPFQIKEVKELSILLRNDNDIGVL